MIRQKVSMGWVLSSVVWLAACGGGGGGSNPPPPPPVVMAPSGLSYSSPQVYAVGTAITALSPSVTGSVTTYSVAPTLPSGLQLAANGQISGTPTTATPQTTYVVTATNSGGNTTFNLVIAVNASYSIGGSVSGLIGGGLTLTNNGGGSLTINADGAFTFSALQPSGTAYAVVVATQPANQACSITSASGSIGAANITTIAVSCVSTYTVGGTVSGLTGAGLVLRNNGAVDLPIVANGAFTFLERVPSGGAYAVSVWAQPAGQTCTPTQAVGVVGSANVTNVTVTCVAVPAPTYSIGGSLIGLTTPSVVLRNNGGDPLSVGNNGTFAFNGRLTSGATYTVSVGTQPPGQTCQVASGSGVVGSANVTNIAVVCAGTTATMGGTVLGLAGTGLTLNNGFADIVIDSNGAFTFPGQFGAGLVYNVRVSQAPAAPAQTCAISNGRGTTTTTAITNIAIFCVNTPAAGRFLFVSNYLGNSISAYTVNAGTGALSAVMGSPFAVTTQTYQMVAHPNNRFLYTRNATTNNIQAFAINQTTGALSAVAGGPFAAGAGAGELTLDRSGKWLIVPNRTAQSLSVFAVNDTTGALTPVPGSPFAVAYPPSAVYFRPDSAFVYVSDPAGNEIAGYAVNAATGTLTTIGPFFSTHSVTTLKIDTLGKFLYGSTQQDSIYAATINSTTGALTPVGLQPVATGDSPRALAIEPLGRFLYVALTDSPSAGAVSGFAINPTTGALTPAGTQPTVGTGSGALQNGLAIRLDGRFMFAATLLTDSVWAWEIDSTTGQLYTVPGSPTATGGGPNAVSLDPAGRWVYVTNAVTNTVSVYSTDLVTGTLTAVPGSPFAAGSGPIGQIVVP